jgi:hypothetical protein
MISKRLEIGMSLILSLVFSVVRSTFAAVLQENVKKDVLDAVLSKDQLY